MIIVFSAGECNRYEISCQSKRKGAPYLSAPNYTQLIQLGYNVVTFYITHWSKLLNFCSFHFNKNEMNQFNMMESFCLHLRPPNKG